MNYTDVAELVPKWIEDYKLRVTIHGQVMLGDTNVTTNVENYGLLWKWYRDAHATECARLDDEMMRSKHPGRIRYPKMVRDQELSGYLFKVHVPSMYSEYKRRLSDVLSHDGTVGDESLREMLGLITGGVSLGDYWTMMHWMWQAKRALINRDSTGQIFLALYGKQGKWKSKVLKKILGALGELLAESNISTMANTAAGAYMQERYAALIFDELDGLGREDVKRLKNIITCTDDLVRPLYSNSMVRVRRRAALCGSTNIPLDSMVEDSTGMRRWWQLDFLDTFDDADFSEFEKLDFLSMWRFVDENREDGYWREGKPHWAKTQEDMRYKGPVEQWVMENRLMPAEGSEVVYMKSSVLHKIFINYQQSLSQNFRPDSIRFGKMMKALGFRSRRSNGWTSIVVNAGHALEQSNLDINFDEDRFGTIL